ncbi:MAG: hypothetical protein ED559_07695 [Phycisphaera sp.]|nr:MAG: hypothetical protein ED559_07695 [Phycisphaera sp.]
MPEFIKKPGNILTMLMVAIVFGMLVTGSVLTYTPSSSDTELVADVKALDLEVQLQRVGITPESLAAAGVRSNEVGGVISSAREFLTGKLVSLRKLESQHAGSQANAERLRRILRSGQASGAGRIALADAEGNLARNLSQIDSLRKALFESATSGLSDKAVLTLQTIASNSRWTCPIQYRCSTRTEADWIRIRDALANDRISRELGEKPDPDLQRVLASCNADGASVLARTNLQTNLDAVRSAFKLALNP